MKKNLLLLLAFSMLGTSLVKSQSTTPKYLSVLSGNFYNLSNDHLIAVGNAQALSVGNTRYSSVFAYDGFGASTITRLDSAARPIWSKFYDLSDPGSNHTRSVFSDIKQGADGDFALVGNTGVHIPNVLLRPNYGSGFVVKVNSNGAVVWTGKLKDLSTKQYVPLSIAACRDSGFAICGKVLASPTSSLERTFIARVSKTGNLLWMKQDTASLNSNANSIVNSGDSSFYLLGSRTVANKEVTSVWRFSPSGQLQWTKSYDVSTTENMGFSMVSAGDGLLCLAGRTEIHLFKISYDGSFLFAKKYDAYHNYSMYENCRPKLKILKNSQLLISNPTSYPAAIITNSLGATQWIVSIGNNSVPGDAVQLNNKDFLFSENENYSIITLDKDSLVWGQEGFIVTDSLGSGSGKCYVKSTASESTAIISETTIATGFQNTGTLTPFQTSITTNTTTAYIGCRGYAVGITENNYSNLKLFPNPATNKLFITSDDITLNDCEFWLFDLDGKLLMNTKLNGAENKSVINIDTLQNGVYFYRLNSPHRESKVGKLIVAQAD